MANKTYAQIQASASLKLQDAGNAIFATTELDERVAGVLDRISRVRPWRYRLGSNSYSVVKSTVADSWILSLTTGDMWKYLWTDELRYQYNKQAYRRGFVDYEGALELNLDFAPAAVYSVYLYLAKRQILQKAIGTTDTAGAVSTAGAVGDVSLVIKSLGTGTINEDTKLTIAGDSTIYHVTADATITTNVATVSIWPPLQAICLVDAVVTLALENTLPVELEDLVARLIAAKAAVSKSVLIYQQAHSAITSVGTAGTAIGLVAARVTQAIADIASGRVESAKISAILDTANLELDKIGAQITLAIAAVAAGKTEADKIPTIVTAAGTAIAAVAAMITQATTDFAAGRTEAAKVVAIILTARTELDKIGAQITLAISAVALGKTEADKVPAIVTNAASAIAAVAARVTQAITDLASARTAIALGVTAIGEADTELDLANPEVDKAVTALTSGLALVNTVPIGGGAQEYMNQAASDVGVAQGYGITGQTYLQKASADFSNAQSDLGLANGEVNTGLAKLREAQVNLEQANADMAANRTFLENALADVRNAQTYLQEAQGYFQQGTADLQLNQGYVLLGNGQLSAAASKMQEANTNINQANADAMANRALIESAVADLRNAQAYHQEAQGYMGEANTRMSNNLGFLQDAAHEVQAGQLKIQEANASLSKSGVEARITQLGRNYEMWGTREEAAVERELQTLVRTVNGEAMSRS
mgnify:CR=1 FL=1